MQGRDSMENDPRPGWSVEVTTPEIIAKVEKLLLEDARLKKKQIAEIVGVSKITIFKILHDQLDMTKVSARWEPRMLTPLQIRVECSREFLDLCGEDKVLYWIEVLLEMIFGFIIMNLSLNKTQFSFV